MSDSEEWRPVVGYEGYYEVSSVGRIRSIDRVVLNPYRRTLRGKVLRPAVRSSYPAVNLYRGGKSTLKCRRIHQLVLEAFVGPAPDGADVCHNNGDATDNRVENLRYGTRSENQLDSVRHGTHPEANKTHCPQGHEYTTENIYRANNGRKRRCRTCHLADQRRRRGVAR